MRSSLTATMAAASVNMVSSGQFASIAENAEDSADVSKSMNRRNERLSSERNVPSYYARNGIVRGMLSGYLHYNEEAFSHTDKRRSYVPKMSKYLGHICFVRYYVIVYSIVCML